MLQNDMQDDVIIPIISAILENKQTCISLPQEIKKNVC